MAPKTDKIGLLISEIEKTINVAVKLRLQTTVYLLRMAKLDLQMSAEDADPHGSLSSPHSFGRGG